MKNKICGVAFLLALLLTATFVFSMNFANNNENGFKVEDSNGLKTELLSYTYSDITTYTENDMALRWLVPNVVTDNGAFCHIMQGMHVGTTYVYSAKSDDDGKHSVFYRTNIKTGETSLMKYYASDVSAEQLYSTEVGYVDEIVVRSVSENGASSNYMYITTGKAPYSLARLKVSGEKLYFNGCFDTVDIWGNSKVMTSVKWMKTSGGYHYFLLKSNNSFYLAKISTSSAGGSVTSPEKVVCVKLFDVDFRNALFLNANGEVATVAGIENWTQNGFEYDVANKFLYLSLYNNDYNRQSAVVTYNLDNVISDEALESKADVDVTVYPTKLSFMVVDTEGSYFEIETCGFRTGQGTAGDTALYFNVNSDDNKEGIYSFGYKRHKDYVENLISDDSVVYTVKYDGNGNDFGEMASSTHVKGIRTSLLKNQFSKEGYSFRGWYFYRKSDQKWLYEERNEATFWCTEGEQNIGCQKYLAADCFAVDALTSVKGDTIICYAVWSKDSSDSIFDGYYPIDLGSEFYGKARQNGKYVTNKDGVLVLENIATDNSQTFRFVKQADGSYTIFDYTENTVWDVSGAMFVDERTVNMYESNETSAQKFYIYFIDGKFYLRTHSAVKLLGANAKNGDLQIFGEVTGENTAFELLKTSLDGYSFKVEDYQKNYGTESVAFIKNSATGKFMTAEDDNLIFKDALWDDSQKWIVKKCEDGSYSFVSVKTGKAVTVIGGGLTYGGDIDLDVLKDDGSQSFYLQPATDGYTYIKPVYSSYLFDMDTNNFDVHTYPYGEGEVQQNAQRFEIISNVCNGKTPIYFGTEFDAYIHAPQNTMITDDGDKIYGGVGAFAENQLFTFVYDEKYDAYAIIGSSGKAVSVENAEDKNGARLVLSSDENLPWQRFYIYADGTNYFIKSVFSNKLFDLDSGSNTTMQIYGDDVTERRWFAFVKVTHNGAKPVDLGSIFTAKIKSEDFGVYINPSYVTLAGSNDGFFWTFTRQSNGSYIIKNASTNAAWEVMNGSVEFGANVRSYDGRGLINQNFFIYETDGGYIFQPCISAGAVTYSDTGVTTVEQISQKGQTFILLSEGDELVFKNGAPYSMSRPYILGISEKTTVGDIISWFDNENVLAFDMDGNELSVEAYVGTDTTFCLVKNGSFADSVEAIILGDTDGNGIVDSTDYLRVKQYFLDSFDMAENYALAADIDGNGIVDSTDYLRIKSHFLDAYNIWA